MELFDKLFNKKKEVQKNNNKDNVMSNTNNNSVLESELSEDDGSRFITLVYSKKATIYDSKEIRLYKKYDEDIYFIRLDGTAYNTSGTLYFDLEKDYFINHSIDEFCDFIQEKCIWNNEDYFSDFREIIKQNHTVLQLFKKDNVSYTEEIPKLYHWTSSSKSEMLLIEIYCNTGGGEGIVIDSSSNTPYHKWWDMGNMWGNRSLEMTWEQVENVDPIKFKGINEYNWKKYIK